MKELDRYKLNKSLKIFENFRVEKNIEKFTKFDLTTSTDIFGIPVNSPEEVMYLLDFYKLSKDVNTDLIQKLYNEKRFNNLDKVKLALIE